MKRSERDRMATSGRAQHWSKFERAGVQAPARPMTQQHDAPSPGESQPKIFVLSLERSSKRRATIGASLKAHGLQFEFLDAVDAIGGLPESWKEHVDRTQNPELSDQELGCALSHAQVYRHMIAASIPHAIVLEDDAIPTSRLVEFIRTRAYTRANLILLYHQAAYVRLTGRKEIFPGTFLTRLATSCSGAVAYSLNLQAARALAVATTPVRDRSDWPLELRTLGACLTQPITVEHPPDPRDSLLQENRSRRSRGLRRRVSSSYLLVKWRRLLARRVHGHRIAPSS